MMAEQSPAGCHAQEVTMDLIYKRNNRVARSKDARARDAAASGLGIGQMQDVGQSG